ARYHDRQSAYGAYLDIVLDFVVYAAVPAALAFESALPEAVPAVVALLAAFYVNAASWMYLSAIDARRGALAETTTALTTVPMPPGIVAGTETVFAYVLFFLFPRQLPWLFLATALLVMANVVMRLWWGRRHLR
ncbi:MAG: CDP-alcohol phosphatidyltransferase family protein, partial [Vicinamibacterales bacterium]